MAIRSFVPADAHACGAIVGATPLWQRSGLGATRAAAILTSASAVDTVLVLELDGVVAGFAWIDPRGVFGRSSYLRMIAVAPDTRGRGIGAELMDAFEQIAADHGPDAFLLVSDFNTDAQRFYARRGYIEVGRIPGYIMPDVAEILLWRRLRSPA